MQKKVRRVWVQNGNAVRVFLALPVSNDWKAAFIRFQKHAQRENMTCNVETYWTPPDNYHITIRFIGMLPRSCITGLIARIDDLSDSIAPFSLPFDRITTATRNEPKMIWARFETTKAFGRLVLSSTRKVAQFLLSECGGMGLVNGHRVIPHVTLARFKGRIQSKRYLPLVDHPVDLAVSSLVLYASETRPNGSVYRILKECALSGKR